jgi:hypothetical protein
MLRAHGAQYARRLHGAPGARQEDLAGMRAQRVELGLCASALLALGAGIAVYVSARGAQPVVPALAHVSGSLPTLLHTLAFALLALAVAAPWPRLAPWLCVSCAVLEWAFELLQLPALARAVPWPELLHAVPAWQAYLRGTFDPVDLVAAATGAALAYAIAVRARDVR